jgi:hypothetical protein
LLAIRVGDIDGILSGKPQSGALKSCQKNEKDRRRKNYFSSKLTVLANEQN